MLKQNKYFIFDNQSKRGVKYYIKKFLYCLMSYVYKIKLNLSHPVISEKKYNVSICAIFKNEAPYLKEWIEFNHLIGVEHFYMYNNNSEDDFRPILAPYIKKGWITLIEWPYNQRQMDSYINCIKRFAYETKWLGFIDIDEFIVPKTSDNIYDFLQIFEKNRGAVNIYWRLYGTSGRMERDINGLVSEDFTVCWPKYCDIGKCFYNTAFGFDEKFKMTSQLHHFFWANWKGRNIPPVNVFDKVCFGSRNIVKSEDFPIQINHYFTKSYKEYNMKCTKGDVYFENNPHDETYFYRHEMRCTDVDYSAYKYLNKLKIIMEKD